MKGTSSKLTADLVYDRFESGSGSKLSLTEPEIQAFIRASILKTLNKTEDSPEAKALKPNTDLFSFGVDSMQSVRVRNVCQKELELGGATLGGNVVYENPSIQK